MLENIILETRNVSKYFGGLKAVDGVSLQVQAGKKVSRKTKKELKKEK